VNTLEPAICVATRYRSIAELVERMHPYCDERTLFVATQQIRAAGTRVKFALQLADRTTALSGWCEVVEAWSTADNRYHRPGVQLALRRLTPDSQLVFDQLLAARLLARVRASRGGGGQRRGMTITARIIERAHHRSDDTGERTQVKPRRRARSTTVKLRGPGAALRSWPRRATGPTRPNRAVASARAAAADHATALDHDGATRRTDPFDRVILPANPLGDVSDAAIGRMVDRHVGGDAVVLPLPAPEFSGPVRALDATLALLLADPTACAAGAHEPSAIIAIGTHDLSPCAADAVRAADADRAIATAAGAASRVRWGVVALTALIVLAIAAALGLGPLR